MVAVKRSQRIGIVIELAQRKQDEAAEQLRHQQQIFALQQRKLEELLEYYAFYEQRSRTHSSGLRASELGRSRVFLEQMQQAINSQRQQVAAAERQMLAVREIWHHSYLKLQSLQDLQQRYQQQEQTEQDRREQRQVDDWVTQRSGRDSS